MVDTNILINQLEDWWMKDVYENHKKNISRLQKPSSFNINPFLHPYIANFIYGDISPKSLAKALVLPRAMGTSVATTFGSKMQDFIVANIEHAQGSAISGIDIEFKDQTKEKKDLTYCQVKAGPNTINADDVRTIVGKFTKLRNKARLDKLPVQNDALIVGILYGSRKELSGSYKAIETNGYGVFIGSEFWEKLTGDNQFFEKMSVKLSEISDTLNEQEYIEDIVEKLSTSPEIIALSKLKNKS